MREDIKSTFIKEWFDIEDKSLAEKAIERLEKRNPFALVREKANHCKDLDKEELFGSIDKVISYLTKLKEEGYTDIIQIWYSYEHNGFVAQKEEDETDEEMFQRFYENVSDEMRVLELFADEEAKKNAEIKRLEQRLRELKGK